MVELIISVAAQAYDLYSESKKRKRADRDRLADVYARLSDCMQAGAESLRKRQKSWARLKEFQIYMKELPKIFKQYVGGIDSVNLALELTSLETKFVELQVPLITEGNVPTAAELSAMDGFADELEEAAGQFAAWATLLRV